MLLTSGGHARLTAKNGAWVHFFLFGASVLRCACISSVKSFQFFWKLFQFLFSVLTRTDVLLPSPIFQLEFELRLAGACLAVGMCVFNEFVCVFGASCLCTIHLPQRLSGVHIPFGCNYVAVHAIRVVEQDQPCPPMIPLA